MRLKVRRGFTKSIIMNESGERLFTIKKDRERGTAVYNIEGTPVYTVTSDPAPLDKRDKYIFINRETGNEFYAWVNTGGGHGKKPVCRYLMSLPVEVHIEAESFFGELDIRRSGILGFDILINGKKRGKISRGSISCEEIDDYGLLAMLYVFAGTAAEKEDGFRARDAV